MASDLLLLNKVGDKVEESYNLGRIHNFVVGSQTDMFGALMEQFQTSNIEKEKLQIASELLHHVMKVMARDLDAIEELPTKILDSCDDLEKLGKQQLLRDLYEEHRFELKLHN